MKSEQNTFRFIFIYNQLSSGKCESIVYPSGICTHIKRFVEKKVKIKEKKKMAGKSKLNFIEALSYIFYVTKIFGLIPYSISSYRNQKLLTSSFIGNLQSIIWLISYIFFYHATVSQIYFNRNPFDSGNNTNHSQNEFQLFRTEKTHSDFFTTYRNIDNNNWNFYFVYGTNNDEPRYDSNVN